MRYGSVAAMVAYLDRKEREKACERRLRKNIRKLTPRLKKFALALKRVLMDVPGPENLHREKNHESLKNKACDVPSDAKRNRRNAVLRGYLWRGCEF